MGDDDSSGVIPKDVAYRLCEEIRLENKGKRFSFARMQCGGCVNFSKGDPAKMCLASRPDYRGCNLVNKRYDQQKMPT